MNLLFCVLQQLLQLNFPDVFDKNSKITFQNIRVHLVNIRRENIQKLKVDEVANYVAKREVEDYRQHVVVALENELQLRDVVRVHETVRLIDENEYYNRGNRQHN